VSNPYIKESTYPAITSLTLGENKNIHVITCKDRFLDNGLNIQLIKEIPMKVRFPSDSLTLDETAINKLFSFKQIAHQKHEYGHARVFSVET
jgi:hypothetical protein